MEKDTVISWNYEAIEDVFKDEGIQVTNKFMDTFLDSKEFNKLIDKVNQDIFNHLYEYAAEHLRNQKEHKDGDL